MECQYLSEGTSVLKTNRNARTSNPNILAAERRIEFSECMIIREEITSRRDLSAMEVSLEEHIVHLSRKKASSF
jgi:hypothetical protein